MLGYIANLPGRLLNQALNAIDIKHHNVRIGEGYMLNGRVNIKGHGIISIGNGFLANSGKSYNPVGDSGLWIVCSGGGTLSIGDNVGISNSTICCANKITICDNVNVGGGCKIFDTDFHSVPYAQRKATPDSTIKTKPVWIGEGAWLGGYVTVLKGVTIGERSVIGAGSVVTKDIPPDEVWAGNPARFIKKIDQANV